MDTKGEIERNTIIVKNLSTSLTPMDRSSRYKIDKETWALNDTLDQIDLTYRKHSIQKQQNTHSFQVYMETFPRMDHMLDDKIILGKLLKVEMI